MKAKVFTPKSEQQMRSEINEVIENLTTLMHWNRDMSIDENRTIFNTVANQLYNCIEKLNKV